MSGQWIPGFWSAESKGKGKGGVSKGKGKGKGKSAEAEDWICKEVGCKLDRQNFSWRTHCMGCGCVRRTAAQLQQARNGAKKQLASETVEVDGFAMTRQQRRKALRKKKVEDKKEAEGQKEAVAEGAQKAEEAGGAAAEVESDVSAKDLAKLGGVKGTTPDFKGLFFMPAPPKEGAKTAVEMVAEAAACRSAITLSTLEVRARG